MAKKTEENLDQGEKLMTAVERILDDTENLVALADRYLAKARAGGLEGEAAQKEASEQAIGHFSNLTALSGGAAALPGVIPGVGSLVAFAGGALADMGLMLKFEVELAMVLAHLHGYDIRKPEEKQLAFLLASVGTHDAKSGGNFLVDVAKAEGTAIWNYAPRQVSKMITSVLAKIALLQVSKGFLRALPLVGVGVSAGMNKVLTTRVGERCVRELVLRAKLTSEAKKEEETAVDAKVRKAR